MNGVAMARHGPILKDNEATGSGKVFKYLPGLRDIIFISKMAATRKRSKPFAVFQQAGEPSRLAIPAGAGLILVSDERL